MTTQSPMSSSPTTVHTTHNDLEGVDADQASPIVEAINKSPSTTAPSSVPTTTPEVINVHPQPEETTSRHGGNETPPTTTTTTTTPPRPQAELHAPIEMSRARFWAVFLSLMVTIFLYSLDQLIVATAIPKITEQFNSLSQLSWIANGFFLTLLSFSLLYSQAMTIFPSKHVILFAVFVFELGSLICGVAPNMIALIFGRAIAGLGAAGIFGGGLTILAEITSLHNRALYFALFGICFAVASVIGPLVGGAFSDHVTWRWCFYINLPFGGIAMTCLVLFQPSVPPLGRAATYQGYDKHMFLQVLQLDWVGMILSLAWAVCIILGLQWGGVTRKWNDAGVIVCLVLAFVLVPVFCVYEYWIGERAFFRIRLIARRSIAGALIVSASVAGIMMILIYYLSLAYQAVYHSSATGAGVRLLPLILVQVFALIFSSRIIPIIGRYKYVIASGPAIITIACGLFYSVKVDTSEAHLYGYQALFGIGIGMCIQNAMMAVQQELKREPKLIALGTGLAAFMGFVGRIIGLSVGGSVFENMLQRNLRDRVPGITLDMIAAIVSDATAVWKVVPENMRGPVLNAYTKTVSEVYIIGVPLGIIGLAGALIMKNGKMLTKEQEQNELAAGRERAAAAAAAAQEENKNQAGIVVSGPSDGAAENQTADGQAVSAEKEGKTAV
ncbi:hypothetical protein IAR55_005603 [Kwoniella newhampshirensis]|uniref:Major facilitator superfamily (MFS) profile domain-containing protein n=1 Tax=Kwoniella newhampshirensis TaxID=1651941 RepID=A0AAW0YGC1_9TREE